MMTDREDLVKRSLATRGEEADESGAARRKSRFMTSIASLKTDPAERARIESIAADAGIADRAGNVPRAASTNVPPRRADSADLDPPGSTWNRNRPIRRPFRRVSDFLAWVGGGFTAILEHMPQARAAFVQMGGILLTTAGIAVASMIFALHDALNVPLLPSVCLSLLWGVIILNINRFLVLSMGSTRDLRRLLAMAIPRVVLSVLLAVLISTPLVLRIFASDIDSQLVVMHQQRSEQFAALAKTSAPQQEANQVMARITADQAILNGNLPESITSPQLQAAQAQVSSLQAAAQRDYQVETDAYKAWQCQLDGRTCAGGSGVAGAGPLAQEAYQQYLHTLGTYNSTESQLSTAENAATSAEASLQQAQAAALSRYQAEARASLPGLESQYQALQTSLQATVTQADIANNADTGILAQLEALSAASAHSPSLEAARLAVLALFLVIELLPVTVKFLLNLGPVSSYERVAQAQEIEAQRIEEERSRVRIEIELDKQAREVQLGKRANEYVAAEMAKILDHALQEWGDEAYAKLFPDGEHMDASVAKVIMETRPEIWEQLKAVS